MHTFVGHGHERAGAYVRMWRPEVDTGYLPFSCLYYVETESVTEPGAHRLAGLAEQ